VGWAGVVETMRGFPRCLPSVVETMAGFFRCLSWGFVFSSMFIMVLQKMETPVRREGEGREAAGERGGCGESAWRRLRFGGVGEIGRWGMGGAWNGVWG
jgi:hypothetical protein